MPNKAPLGACFIAWTPANQLRQWLQQAHDSHDGYQEKLDQKMRISVISIHKRGFEVTLKTKTEPNWIDSLDNTNHRNEKQQNKQANLDYQQALSQERYHLDHIDRKAHYEISRIAVPVFNYSHLPEINISANIGGKTIKGADIEDIAQQLQLASYRVGRPAVS